VTTELLDNLPQVVCVLFDYPPRLLHARRLVRHLGRRLIFIMRRLFGRRHRRDGRLGSKGTIELNQKGPLREQRMERGQHQNLRENTARTDCTDFARLCTPLRPLFCVQMPIEGSLYTSRPLLLLDMIIENGAARQD
jgi:hypothetical protein